MVSHTAYIQQSKLSSDVHDSSHGGAVGFLYALQVPDYFLPSILEWGN